MNNRQEYVAGTDPTRSNSVLAVGLTRDSAGGWRIAFEAASPARLYDVWWTSNLVTGLWQPVVSNQWGTGREMMWVVPTNRGKAGYFKAKARVEERVGW
jgi:hypothetical protein